MATNTNCYLCNNTKIFQRLGSVRNQPELTICECSSCGLVFLSSFDHIQDGFYETSKMHGSEPFDVRSWLQEVEWDDERRFQYLKALLPKSSLLDFGCGAGGFLLKARKLTAVAEGVEIEKKLYDHFESHGLTIVPDIDDLPPKRKYDIITLFHVLEHHHDPKSLLSGLKDRLAPNGRLIVEVPHADDSLLTFFQCEAFSHFTYRDDHLFLFTEKTLSMLASDAGLKTNYIRQVQRYPLSNHLYWLANGKPGGHQVWHFLDSPELHAAYEKQLASIGKTDTIIASISKA